MSFEIDIKRFAKKLNNNGRDAMRKTTTAAYGGIMRGTRVDTGAARANWNVNLGSVNRTTRDPQGAPRRGDEANGSEGRQSGFVKTTTQIKAGKTGDVYISNSLPYIFSLEEKDHMVRDTVNEVKKSIESGIFK